MKRANFLKSLLGVSAFLGSPFSSIANGSIDEIEDLIINILCKKNAHIYEYK